MIKCCNVRLKARKVEGTNARTGFFVFLSRFRAFMPSRQLIFNITLIVNYKYYKL